MQERKFSEKLHPHVSRGLTFQQHSIKFSSVKEKIKQISVDIQVVLDQATAIFLMLKQFVTAD